jgi:hypothetical protein
MHHDKSPIYVFNTHEKATTAIQALSKAGLDVKKLSLVGKGFHTEEHPVGFYTAGARIKYWGGTGAFWGSIWGLLVAPAVFFIPGLGMVAMAGPLVAALVGALEGAAIGGGISALGAALLQSGVPRDQIIRYETALKVDKYVLTVHGTSGDSAKVRSILTSADMMEEA